MAESTTPQGNSTSQSTASQYSEGVDNASKTISLLQQVDDFTGGMISGFFETRSNNERLKIELGQWYDKLYDEKTGTCYDAVLSVSSFTEYMNQCRGMFRPVGKCRATAAWVQLVHALGITPTQNNILSRNKISGSDVALQVDGEVICHIVNILDVSPSHPWRFEATEGIYETSIGQIVWKDGNVAQAGTLSFEPSSEAEIESRHEMFPHYRRLKHDPDALLAQYWLALDVGISDVSMTWPNPSVTPLSERLSKYNDAVQKLGRDSYDLSRSTLPTFVTQSWQKDADRVRRRVSGGENSSGLLHDACTHIPKIRTLPGWWSGAGSEDVKFSFYDSEERNLDLGDAINTTSIRLLKDWLTGKAGFELIYEDHRYLPSRTAPEDVAEMVLEKALTAYGDMEPGSWQHDLYVSRETVTMLFKQGRFVNVPPNAVFTMPLDRSATLWRNKKLRVC